MNIWHICVSSPSPQEAHRLALEAKVTPNEAELLATINEASRSPNRLREAWIDAATDMMHSCSSPPKQAMTWLGDAEIVTNPYLGQRIAAETCAYLVANMIPKNRQTIASRMLNQLYHSCAPDPVLAYRSVSALKPFQHLGRVYLPTIATNPTLGCYTAVDMATELQEGFVDEPV